MSRRKDESPQKKAMREMMKDYLRNSDVKVKDGTDVNAVMYVGENESAKFWLSIMNGLKNRGVKDILIACVDGLAGFPQAIEAVFPNTEVQHCMIHQIRNSTRFVSYKDIKALMADLKRVYAAATEEIAYSELERFGEIWNAKYPKIFKSWNDHWPTLSTYFKYPEPVRRLIYTTNAIETGKGESLFKSVLDKLLCIHSLHFYESST